MIESNTLSHQLEKAATEFGKGCALRIAEGTAANEPQESLFHYTNENAFKSIFETEQFWYTSIYHMDDTEELNFGFDVCTSLLQIASEDAHKVLKLFFEPLIEDGLRQEVRAAVEFYSISFGTRDDIKQWNSYGDSGGGVAFGLLPEFFHPTLNRNPKPEECIFVGKVAYGDSNSRARHSHVIQSASEIILREFRAGNLRRENAQAFYRRLAAEMYVEVLWNSVTTKDDDWRHQNEVRLLVLNRLAKPQLAIHNPNGRPFVKIPQPGLKSCLTEVIVGPKAHSNAEQGIQRFLTEQDLRHVRVTRSSAT
jgi:hypothetical protein